MSDFLSNIFPEESAIPEAVNVQVVEQLTSKPLGRLGVILDRWGYKEPAG